MRILFLNYEYPPIGGGGGVGSKILVDELSKNHPIDIITSKTKGIPFVERHGNVTVYRVPVFFRRGRATSNFISMLFYCVAASLCGMFFLGKNKYNLIHSFFVLPTGVVGLFLSKLYSVPHILTLIGGDIYDPSKKFSPDQQFVTRVLVRKIVSTSERAVAISSDVANRAKKIHKIKKEIKIVPFPFEPPGFDLKHKKEKKQFVLVTVTRLVKRKSLDDLLKALELIKNEDLKLMVVGDGPEKDKLKRLSSKLKIDNIVTFVGFKTGKEKFNILSSSDCFVLPSQHEGQGLVFLEAMFCGLPIITTNVGGQTDFLEDGKTGFLVPVGDVDELAKAIKTVKSDSKFRKKVTAENKKRVKKFYPSKIAKHYKRLYQDILDK